LDSRGLLGFASQVFFSDFRLLFSACGPAESDFGVMVGFIGKMGCFFRTVFEIILPISKNNLNNGKCNVSDDEIVITNCMTMIAIFELLSSIFDTILSDCNTNLSVFMR